MSLNSSDAAQNRVVSLIKRLDDDALQLRQETHMLQEAHDQWAPAKVGGRTALMPGEKPLPSRCADKLEQAAAYESQISVYLRRAATGDREAQRAARERQQAESSAEVSVQSASARRIDAERCLEELQKERRAAEAEHARVLSAEEVDHEAALRAIDREIEEVWKAAAAHSSQARRDTAAQRTREEREIAEAKADSERRSAAYECALNEYDAECDAGIAKAGERKREAELAVESAWKECEAQVQSTQDEREREMQECHRRQDAAIDETNKQLADLESELAAELADISAQEQAAGQGIDAVENIFELRAQIARDIEKRRSLRDARVQECVDVIARLTREASDAAAAAAHRIQVIQARTDKQVETVTAEIEKFAGSTHMGKIAEMHSTSRAAIATAKDEYSRRLKVFQEQTQVQTREADMALVSADKRVEELRAWSTGLIDESSQAMDNSIKDMRHERARIVADSSAKVQRTQDQMVQYVGSQFEEMVLALNKTDPVEMPLRLDISSAIVD
jgi:hypothetical protein